MSERQLCIRATLSQHLRGRAIERVLRDLASPSNKLLSIAPVAPLKMCCLVATACPGRTRTCMLSAAALLNGMGRRARIESNNGALNKNRCPRIGLNVLGSGLQYRRSVVGRVDAAVASPAQGLKRHLGQCMLPAMSQKGTPQHRPQQCPPTSAAHAPRCTHRRLAD